VGFLLLPHNELYYVIITKLNESESMLKPVIHGIFPTPLIFTNIEREFTKEELEFFDEQSKTTFKNEGNVTSLDNYLMRHDPMTTIKQEITSALQLYLDEVVKPKDDVKPYITQSWLNYTDENQYHHKHAHPNSFLSGVMYVNADPEKDKITFFNDSMYKQIKLFPKEWNLYNAESWYFTVKPGDIVVFPSSLIHMVEQKAGNNVRTSLAFNSFLRGAIGDKQSLTELLN
jgi:uncharacterized protein (TIGR02466 family)